jgi:hypothetical protein
MYLKETKKNRIKGRLKEISASRQCKRPEWCGEVIKDVCFEVKRANHINTGPEA